MNEDGVSIDDETFEEEELGQDDSDEQYEPFDPKKVDVSISTPTLGTLITRLRHSEIDLMPDFQRSGDLWSKQAQSRLIESILIRLPIPAFYFDATDEEHWQVVDGLQRLSAIKNFVVDQKLRLQGLEFLKELHGSTYDELPRTFQRRIDEFSTSVYLIKPGTPPEMKYALFHRINTGGLKLTPQEIRHAISQPANNGAASKFLAEITEADIVKTVLGKRNHRMSKQELILRHMAFAMFGQSDYKSSLPRFLDGAMIEISKMSPDKLDKYRESFLSAVSLSYELFGVHAFSKSLVGGKNLVNKPLFEALSVCLAEQSGEQRRTILANKSMFVSKFKELLENDEFNEAISRSTASTAHVTSRFRLIRKFIEECSFEALI